MFRLLDFALSHFFFFATEDFPSPVHESADFLLSPFRCGGAVGCVCFDEVVVSVLGFVMRNALVLLCFTIIVAVIFIPILYALSTRCHFVRITLFLLEWVYSAVNTLTQFCVFAT